MSKLYFYDFGGNAAQTYKETCSKCGNIQEVSTQEDNEPEYHTDVFVKCRCGNSIKFILSVN